MFEGPVAQAKDFPSGNSVPEGTESRVPAEATPRPTKPVDPLVFWRFQTSYALWPADVEVPQWDFDSEPAKAEQKLATVLLTQNRFGQSVSLPFNALQATRMGISLLQIQTENNAHWAKSLVKSTSSADWHCWGVGGDLFISRQQSPSISIEAGLQADYLVSGTLSFEPTQKLLQSDSTPLQLAQSGGWRIAFSSGLSGFMFGPVGLLIRLNGYILEANFRGHPDSYRAQGFQMELGADLALGRSEP
jgi:hypothetical protein